jgi:acyl-CoA thioester hydrolase
LNTLNNKKWFKHPVKALPYDTDYGGVVWHGAYLRWLEEARLKHLSSVGLSIEKLKSFGCELPIVQLSLHYHKPIFLETEAIVKTRIRENRGVRLIWDYRIESGDSKELFLTGETTLVVIDQEKRKVLRRQPEELQTFFLMLLESEAPDS